MLFGSHAVEKRRMLFSYDLIINYSSLLTWMLVGLQTFMIIILKAIFVQLLYYVGKYGFSYCHVLIVLNNLYVFWLSGTYDLFARRLR